jgi:hypothetical protein
MRQRMPRIDPEALRKQAQALIAEAAAGPSTGEQKRREVVVRLADWVDDQIRPRLAARLGRLGKLGAAVGTILDTVIEAVDGPAATVALTALLDAVVQGEYDGLRKRKRPAAPQGA